MPGWVAELKCWNTPEPWRSSPPPLACKSRPIPHRHGRIPAAADRLHRGLRPGGRAEQRAASHLGFTFHTEARRLHQQRVKFVVALRKLAAFHLGCLSRAGALVDGRGSSRSRRRDSFRTRRAPHLRAASLGLRPKAGLSILLPLIDFASSRSRGEPPPLHAARMLNPPRSTPAAPSTGSPHIPPLDLLPTHAAQRWAGCSCPPQTPLPQPHRAGLRRPSPVRFPRSPSNSSRNASVGRANIAVQRPSKFSSKCPTKSFSGAAFCRKYPAG